ncbi:MAG: nucleotidyltransferase domain-containing protein [bacterium]
MIQDETKQLIKKIKDKILAIDLADVEGIGIFGSLARGYDFNPKSDIDIFVVVKKKTKDIDMIWAKRIRNSLSEMGRDVTVLVYSVEGLKVINNWYVLRLASEGILFYDKGEIKSLFKDIIKAAKAAGLARIKRDDEYVWSIVRPLKMGEVVEVKVC